MTGTLVLIVGPSGVGKDTPIDGTRLALAGTSRIRFVRRVITRPTDAGSADHQAVTGAQFESSAFMHHWAAHGLFYGVPRDVAVDMAGTVVIIRITASPDTVEDGVAALVSLIAGSCTLRTGIRNFPAEFGNRPICVLHRQDPIAANLLPAINARCLLWPSLRSGICERSRGPRFPGIARSCERRSADLRSRHPRRTTVGSRVAGGVLRLRSLVITPSMIVMPMPGRLPSSTDSSRVLPPECCA